MRGFTFLLLCFALASAPGRADASWPAIPPALPQPQGKVVPVRTEPELQAAVANLASGTTILVAPGTYRLTRTLAVAGTLEDVAIRGAAESRDEVVLVGAGRDNASYGNVPHGIWVSGSVKRLLVANLTIRDVYYHPICVNPGPQALHFYNLRLATAASSPEVEPRTPTGPAPTTPWSRTRCSSTTPPAATPTPTPSTSTGAPAGRSGTT